ncbi:MAG: ferredoxin [Prochlorococcaceae cyanobacterium ETNP1_MAG_9]|nr:ferredoxin [Prochlorococcaceae cyanobacterium ETNP1_MAG_9]
MSIDPSSAFQIKVQLDAERNGREPCLGGQLQEKAVWVDESICIGCRYCAHVATNTFVIEPHLGRSRVIRQDGDCVELIQEAIGTCPVNCIHWVPFEQLDELRTQLEALDLQDLGKLPQYSRRIKRHMT